MAHNQLSILFPWQDEITYQQLPEETWHDLGLDALAEQVARKPQELPLLQRVMTSLSPDPRVSRFRSQIFEDLLQHPDVRERLAELLDKVKMFYDYGVVQRHEGDEAGIWDLMHRLEEYHEYILTVEAIRECLSGRELRSEGLAALLRTVTEIYEENGFAALRQDVEAMRVTASGVQSLTLGINVNDRFEAVSMGLVSVNSKPFTRSGLLKNFAAAVRVRDQVEPEAEWTGSFSYHPATPPGGGATFENLARTSLIMRNPLIGLSLASVPEGDGSSRVTHQMDAAASMLVSRMVRRLRDGLGKYLNVSVRDIASLIPELVFYTRWAEYIEQKQKEGWHFCPPETLPQEEGAGGPRMMAEGLYNLKLIGLEKPADVVTNSLAFDAEKRVFVLTGANRGGKTTLTQAIGQLFLLAQSGIRVPGERFCFDPADQVLTHFPADEDKTMDLGRLGEECRRFRDLYARLTPSSLLLLNETFSTTSFEEGYEIATDALKAILRRGARTIYNTHMHKLARELDTQINAPGATGRAWSLVMETREGQPSFRARLAPPEGKSFARGIAEKYGVTFEQLTGA